MSFPTLSLERQRGIADFLDDQVGRIDGVISRRVTQRARVDEGYQSALADLFPSRPTPAFLLGAQPGAISTRRLTARIIAGGTPDTSDPSLWSDGEDGGTPWITIADMKDGGTTVTTAKAVSASGLAQSRLVATPAGTVLFAMYASVGKTTVSAMSAVWNQAILGLIPAQGVDSGFIIAWLELCRPVLPALARSSTQDNLNADQVARMRAPSVSRSTQVKIGAERLRLVDERTARRSLIERSIELLDERKRALITAAVTGEFDVSTAGPRAAAAVTG